MAPFSKQDLLEEFRVGMQMFASEMAPVVGDTAAASVAWLTPDELNAVVSGFSASTRFLDSPGATFMKDVYDFAFDGRLRTALDDEMYEGLTAWKDRFEGMQQILDCNWRGEAPFRKCVQTVQIAHLRGLFPHGSFVMTADGAAWNCIHLREFAMLAGLEEKTVRNMASPAHKQHIPTLTVGRRTFVALRDALPWLEARGFAPTILTDTRPDRDYANNPFHSRKDLAHFVSAQRARLGLSAEDVVLKLQSYQDAAERVSAIEESRGTIDPEFASVLANTLDIPNPSGFAEAAVDVFASWPPSVLDTRPPRRRRAKGEDGVAA